MSEESKKKIKPSPKVWKFYQIEGSKITRIRKECPRCGKGVFLAEHKNRYTCGKCGDTQYLQTKD